MVMFNLLPWRRYKRSYQLKVMRRIMLLSMLGAGCLISLIYFFLQFLLDKQLAYKENLMLTFEKINQLKLNQSTLHEASGVEIKKILREQKNYYSIFYQLDKKLDHDVCFTKIKVTNKNLTFFGLAFSNYDLKNYLQNDFPRKNVSHLNLQNLKNDESGLHFQFSINAY